MQLIVLVVSQLLAADQDQRACRPGLLSSPSGIEPHVVEIYPRERVLRPLTLPARMWSASGTVVYSLSSAASGFVHGGGFGLGVSVSPVCNLELGMDSGHLLTPPSPFTTLAPRLAVGLTDWLALATSAQLHLQPSAIGLRSASAWLGAPVRVRVVSWLAVTGLEQIVGVETLWGPALDGAGSATRLTASVPFGVILQPLAWLSFEARFRPVVFFTPFGVSTFEFDGALTLALQHWLDVFLLGYVWPSTSWTQVVISTGVRVRF